VSRVVGAMVRMGRMGVERSGSTLYFFPFFLRVFRSWYLLSIGKSCQSEVKW
jgi:hypothetical protein